MQFCQAAAVPKQNSYTILTVFMSTWVNPYFGAPHTPLVDQEETFSSVQLTTLVNTLGCNVILILVEAYWSLITERNQNSFGRIANERIADHPATPLQLITNYASQVMLITIDPKGSNPPYLQLMLSRVCESETMNNCLNQWLLSWTWWTLHVVNMKQLYQNLGENLQWTQLSPAK